MQQATAQARQMEQALRGLIKLLKAVQYYPPTHPTLKTAVTETLGHFAALLQDERPPVLTVRKEGFFLADEPVGRQNPVLAKLAPYLFARRIRTLLFLADLSGTDLRTFARCLTLETREVARLGGIQEIMRRAQIATIWANEVDLERILAQKQEIEAQRQAHAGEQQDHPEQAPAPAAEERTLAQVVAELQREEADQHYRYLLQELIPLVQLHLNAESRRPVLDALALIAGHAADPALSSARRDYAGHALAQLSTDNVLDFLVEVLCQLPGEDQRRRQQKQQREQTLLILRSLQGKAVVWRLMDHLAQESDAQVRKLLVDALVRQGKAAVPVLLDHLEEKPWFVQRNAVFILGEIRDPDAAQHLPTLLQHKDLRVRRETIRALTKIGGQSAVGILLRTVEDGDQELRRQALLSLGAMKNTAAVPTLLRLVEESDPMFKRLEVKREAIKALGEIGAAEAVPTLAALLERRRFWRRGTQDELRVAAALALGEIGAPQTLPVLEKAAEDRSIAVSRAAAQALKQTRR